MRRKEERGGEGREGRERKHTALLTGSGGVLRACGEAQLRHAGQFDCPLQLLLRVVNLRREADIVNIHQVTVYIHNQSQLP